MIQTSAESAPVDLSDLTKPQLIQLAAQTGLTIPVSLSKPKIIERMMAHQLQATTRPKIGVVGFAEGHLTEAPFGDDTWELWGINRLHTLQVAQDKKFHAWFNLHDLNKFHGKDVEHLEFLQQFDGPVYLRSDDIGKFDIPNQTPFPADEMVERFGRYFNNTISWLLAFAITRNPVELGVYGVDMAQDMLMNAEYSQQRPSCEYFLGIASGLGIGVTLPSGSDLLKSTHLYGFEDADPFTEKAMSRLQEVGQRKEQAKGQLAQVEGQRQELVNAINQLDGAMQDTQYWLRNWVPQPLGDIVGESTDGKVE
jgi:hypothetical protein